MSTHANEARESERIPTLPSSPPKGISIQEQEGHLTLQHRNPTTGYGLLSMFIIYVIIVVAYAVSSGGFPASEIIVTAVIGLLILVVPLALIINTTTITVKYPELMATRGPLSLVQTRRLRTDAIENLHVKAETNSNTGGSSGNIRYHLRATLTGKEDPIVLARLGKDYEAAYYIGNKIYEKLGLSGEVGFVGSGKRRGPVRPRPF